MSGLNPLAAPYVPGRFRAVEDYSPEWWELVGSTPWFRDYWLRDRFLDPQIAPDLTDIYDSAITDAFFSDDDDDDDYDDHDHDDAADAAEEEDEGKGGGMQKEVAVWGAEKWRMSRRTAEVARYGEKAPKIVKMRLSPRPIQQPK